MADMKQFMVLVTEVERARLDALRIVMGVSRAEVARQAMTRGPISKLERENAMRLARLSGIAGAAGYAGIEPFVMALVQRPEYRQKTPSLEELEAQYPNPDAGTAEDLGAPDGISTDNMPDSPLARSLAEA